MKIKTNLGHTEAASGIAGIMKAVLAMEAEMIPASIGVKNLNPRSKLILLDIIRQILTRE